MALSVTNTYNVLLVINQKYFELAKICIHSILKNVEVDKIICIYVANIGLEDNAVNYFKTLSTKIAVVETGISTAYTKDGHTKEWVEAVSQKTRILRRLADNGNNLPLVVMDVDQVVLDDFSHVLDHSKDIQVCKREVPAQRPDMVMDYIGSFFVVNNYIALPFLDRWIERIGERIAEGTIPAYETPALCEIIDEFKDKLAIGELSENVVSCNNNFFEGITRIIHMKSETAAESADLVQGRVGGVSNYNHRDILKYIYGDELYNNFLRQNLTGVSYYINIGVREQSQIQALLSDKPAVKYLDYEDLMQKSEGPLDSYASAVVEIQLEDYDSDLDGLIHELSLAVIDLRLFLNVDVKTEVTRAMRIIKYMMESGYCVYFFEEQNQLICKVKDLTDIEYISTKSHSAKVAFYCHHQSKSISLCYFIHSSGLYGAEKSAYETVKNLISRYGVVPTIVLPNMGPMAKWYLDIGVPVIMIDYTWWTIDYSKEDLKRSFINIIRNHKIIEIINPDLIMTQTMTIPWGALTALLMQKPHIWNVREYGELDHGLMFYYPLLEIIDLIKTCSQYITACGSELIKFLFHDLPEDSVGVAYTRIEVGDYNKKLEEVNPCKLNLILPGTIAPHKGQLEAVKALAELVNNRSKKNLKLFIAGTAHPDYLKKLNSYIDGENLADYVEIKDFVVDIYSEMMAADIVLSCSKMEAFGRVPVEGLLMSKPVIASNKGGNLEIIIDGFNGLLYEQGDHIDLADKIQLLLENPHDINMMGKKGPDSVKGLMFGNYAEETIYNAAIKVKNELISYDYQAILEKVINMLNALNTVLQRIYIDSGNGFNENEVYCSYTPVINDEFTANFNFNVCISPLAVRFDPIENQFCRCYIVGIETNTESIIRIKSNAEIVINGWDYFYSSDPIYYLNGDFSNTTWLSIKGQIRLLTNSEITRYIEHKNQGIELIVNSIHRIVTAPFRKTDQYVRKAITFMKRIMLTLKKGIVSLRYEGIKPTLRKKKHRL